MAAKISESWTLFQANIATMRLLISALELREHLTVLTAISANSSEYAADREMAIEVAALATKLSKASSRAMSLELFEGDNHVKQK